MKLLVIGIDGGDRRIVEAMDMPNLRRVLASGVNLEVREDLWTRGWASVLSGRHGRDTGAFYHKPRLDGSHDFTQSFSRRSYGDNPAVVPLWKVLEERGMRAGFMNVPTTSPAPETASGFFVGGAGGGMGGGGAVEAPPEACRPRELAQVLVDEHRYILDCRFRASGITDPEALFGVLGEMQDRRTAAFLALWRRFRPDVGFLAYMATSRAQNLAMSEVEPMLAAGGAAANPFQARLAELYRGLDRCLGELLERLAPEHLLVVSDHGAAPYRFSVNVDPFLRAAGFQRASVSASSAAKWLVRRAAALFPAGMRRGVGQAVPAQVRGSVGAAASARDVDWGRTRAFGARYVSGIYLNDARFGGPVGAGEAAALVGELIGAFNASPEAGRHGMSARPYRALYRDAPFADLLPDVWIDKPDHLFFEGRGAFVQPNADYGPIRDLSRARRDMYTGIKGRRPLLCADPALAALAEDGDPRDLTLAYRLVDRVTAR